MATPSACGEFHEVTAMLRQAVTEGFDPRRMTRFTVIPSSAQPNKTAPTPAPYSQWAMREDCVLKLLNATGGTACRKRWKNHSPRTTPTTSLATNRTRIAIALPDMGRASGG